MEARRSNASGGAGVVMFLYAASGACSLMDEVVWVRLLKLALGNTVQASSVVVSTFLGGLALGAWWMGRRADRATRPLQTYAKIEAAVALSALAVPIGLRAAEWLYAAAFGALESAPAALTAMQIVISAALLLAPTFLMGATLPLLGRYVTAAGQHAGHRVGRLYAVNMLGAAAGCLLAGLVLLRLAGVWGTVLVTAGLNAAVAAAAWWLGRTGYRIPETEDRDGGGVTRTGTVLSSSASLVSGARYPFFILAACFVSGLVSLGYEMAWMRTIALPLGAFTYVFSAVLTVYLVGNVIGAALGSRLARRLAGPGAAFGVSLVCLGAFGVLLGPLLAGWSAQASDAAAWAAWQGPGMRKIALPLLHSAVLFLLPSIAMGAGFPLALEAWSRRRGPAGRSTGEAYAANTAGCVSGGLLTGLVLVPALGVQITATVLGLLAAGVGAALVGGCRIPGSEEGSRREKPKAWALRFAAAGAAAVALVVVALIVPGDLFARRFAATCGGELVAVAEGSTATVAVSHMPDGSRVMSVDNIPMAGDGVHRSAAKSLGHLAALLHGRAKSALTVGFGAGETAECLTRHGIERIDCVEIAPEVVAMAMEHFSDVNLGPRLHEKVRVVYMDARNYVKYTRLRYDIILNDSNVHSTSSSAPLFTREHFAAALDRLNPGGLFVTKLHLQGDPPANFNAILRTFAEVFPHVTVWFPVTRPYVLMYLVGSAGPQRFDPAAIDAELAAPAVRQSAAYLRVRDSVDLLSWYLGDGDDLRRWLPGGPMNSDWRPSVEFNADSETLTLEGHFNEMVAGLRSPSLARHLDLAGLPAAQRDDWLRREERMRQAAGGLLAAHARPGFPAGLFHVWRAVQAWPDHPAVIERRREYLESLRLALKGELLKADDALGALDSMGPAAAEFGLGLLARAWALQRKGRLDEALSAATRAAELCPNCPEAHATLAAILTRLGQSERAQVHQRHAERLFAEQRMTD